MFRGSNNVCNGPLIAGNGMYTVKPYYDNDVPIELPQCMYTLSSIYSNEVVAKTQPQISNTNMVSAQKQASVRV